MSEPKSTTCTRLSEVMNISHDSANRFLLREAYEPRDLFNEAARLLNVDGGTLSADDTVLDKPYSQLYSEVVADFIRSFIPAADYLNSQFRNLVNA